MNPNPVLRRLGLADTDRVVIIHADDIGMCQASVTAYAELFQAGIITSGAVMVPCPWFLAAAALKDQIPDLDLGVHLTLTSEWKTYRWGPVSTRDPASGLIDSQGYFYASAEAAQENAVAVAGIKEMEMQVAMLKDTGLAPTHIDTHMGTVAHPKFMQAYIDLGLKNNLPIMMYRADEQSWLDFGLDGESAKLIAMITRQLEEMQVPLLDHIAGMPLDDPHERLEQTKQEFRKLSPGLTHFILHPSVDTPELRGITADWQCRVADFETFRSEELRKFLDNEGIIRIAYRQLQELLPTSPL